MGTDSQGHALGLGWGRDSVVHVLGGWGRDSVMHVSGRSRGKKRRARACVCMCGRAHSLLSVYVRVNVAICVHMCSMVYLLRLLHLPRGRHIS